ncbi:photosystem II 22 kDa protein, chloroplastic isoform X2 [Spinacia oleracea]|uniref:Cytochrome c-553 n=1 Tax=Spinacia oleracea TaxID=3562 RepID=A0ABM3RE43_SPIOL|nr:photosystem II 22 kDa protein, chloroplastic isoform X2 [Spinacia oleracea]
MAQAMLLMMPGVSTTNTIDLKRNALLKLQIQKIKPKSSTSNLFFSPLPSSSSSSSTVFKTLALFKSKAKAPKKVEKPKLKVEDGLFGTSGGIGFTKENELFVGRVAMIGFADIAKEQSKEEASKLLKHLIPPLMALLVALFPISYTPASSLAIDTARGAALFRRACIGCHDTGGNLIQPGATLFTKDLEKNGVESEEELYSITYNGKGRMPGFGEKCMPRGQCTFGPRLQDEEIRLLAQFVKLQADKGWPNIDFYND